jgi:hypothetical protein
MMTTSSGRDRRSPSDHFRQLGNPPSGGIGVQNSLSARFLNRADRVAEMAVSRSRVIGLKGAGDSLH